MRAASVIFCAYFLKKNLKKINPLFSYRVMRVLLAFFSIFVYSKIGKEKAPKEGF